MSFLQLHGLRKAYGNVTAVDGIELAVAAGSRTAIVGPSGCGKTTLLRLIAGFEAPDAGSIVLDGTELAGNGDAMPAYRRGIGVVAQDGALFPHLSIADNIGFGMKLDEHARDERIAELAYVVGLDKAILRRRPHQLSGGQQQRVALARAMARKPRLMLLDEPFSALDTGLRASMRKAVAELLEQAGIATILVTHDQAEALSFADQVAVMRDGAFSQVGAPRDLYLRPKDRMIAEFLGDSIIMPARIVGGGIAECAIGHIGADSARPRDVARIMLRPEQVFLEPALRADVANPPPNVVFGEVVEAEFAGSVSTVALRVLNSLDPPDAAVIGNHPLILRRSFVDAPTVGAIVRINVLGKAHVFDGAG
ncbi:ABC transporter ATP-binding protein [Aminobacter sp. SR38]|jgi:iron(III) transport system ATP-binding protein|uniref:ABC transporter ATP-binding protein n=1 Tax=Aminobacter sp. SR38 TaxID=2774562 RepID=UPI00178229A1|nr:ABC transporter ATP-binding protein [Aminobacter sp. SR38]QOF70115.1 ABC transporter ATP-binding protein [Aminobacter sp. SR38]